MQHKRNTTVYADIFDNRKCDIYFRSDQNSKLKQKLHEASNFTSLTRIDIS